MMKVATLIINICIFLSLNSLALDTNKLKTGDILLLDMDCFSCTLIEEQTGGPFSHSGMVMNLGGELFIAQALGDVHLLKLSQFTRYTRKPIGLIRPVRINNRKRDLLVSHFIQSYEGMPFDHDFTWDDESLYCSELLYKLLDDVGSIHRFKPRPMKYDINPEGWRRYYGDRLPPKGRLGLSPNDFYRSKDFVFLGYLND